MSGKQSKINDIRSKFCFKILPITGTLSVVPRIIITIITGMSLNDNAASFYQVKFKEDFYVAPLKPKLDRQVDCVHLAAHLHIKFCFTHISLVSLFVMIIYFILYIYYMDSNMNIHGHMLYINFYCSTHYGWRCLKHWKTFLIFKIDVSNID